MEENKMTNHALAGTVSFLLAAMASGQDSVRSARAETFPTTRLKAEIDALRAPRVAWREIAWKSCLLEGLAESRAKNKPVLLWIFIDRPIDDARC
jgi:hypothetical protein